MSKFMMAFRFDLGARVSGRWAFALSLMLVLCRPLTAVPAPVAHGVIFFCPPRADSAVAELENQIRDLTAGGTQVNPDTPQTFTPLAMRLYHYERKSLQ